METLIAAAVIAVLVIIVIGKTAVVVPQQNAYVVEYLGKYRKTIQAGFHILIPFVEKIAYRHNLKGTRSTSRSRFALPGTTCRSAWMGCST